MAAAAVEAAELAMAQRRRDAARRAAEIVKAEIEELKALLAAAGTDAPIREGDTVRVKQLGGLLGEVVDAKPKGGRLKVRLAHGQVRQLSLDQLEVASRRGAPAGEARQKAAKAAAAVGGRPQGPQSPPLLSPQGLQVHSLLKEKVGSLPCELLPLVHSSIARVEIPAAVLERLKLQVKAVQRHSDALDRSARLTAEVRDGQQLSVEHVDREYERLLLETCSILAFGTLGTATFRCELDRSWAVVQERGDYVPMEAHRNGKAPTGFSSILDLELPACLSTDNHEVPTKGSYGFHDGLHNLLWKTDRTTDQYDLVQPGIVQCELVAGFMYVFPQQLQGYTYPFSGQGQRSWLCSSVALLGAD